MVVERQAAQDWPLTRYRMRQNLVSIVIPIYNAGRYLDEAIQSVFAQTYRNWELILVDDGSTDGSSELARQYAARYSEKMRYVIHEGRANRGQSASRNLGIRTGSGDLIAFLDQDDVWFSDKLAKQVQILREHPEAGLVYGQARVWRSWSESVALAWGPDYNIVPNLPLDSVVPPSLVLLCFLRHEEFTPFPSATLVRRAEIERSGGFEDEYRGIHEDQVFFAKLCTKSSAYVCKETVCLFRVRPDSASHAALAEGRHRTERCRFLEWLTHYLSDRVPRDSELWRELQIQRRPYTHPTLYKITPVLSAVLRAVLPAAKFHSLRAWWRGVSA